MADISKSFCMNHPDTPAAARCATCGKHICAQCVVERNGSKYCSEQCAEAAANSTERVNTAANAGRNIAVRSRIRTIIILIILAAAAAGGWIYYKNNKSKVDSFVEKTGKNVQKGLDTTKKSIQKSVPGDSKYKRDTEAAVGK